MAHRERGIDLWRLHQGIAKPCVRFGLLGFGNVGRNVILKNANRYRFNFYWVADSRNLISKANRHRFTNIEMRRLVRSNSNIQTVLEKTVGRRSRFDSLVCENRKVDCLVIREGSKSWRILAKRG